MILFKEPAASMILRGEKTQARKMWRKPRAKELLESIYDGVTVRLNHDKGATPELGALARNANVLVVCWQSASHAATDCITQQRPKTKSTLMAEGKGSSSILRMINDYAKITKAAS